MTQLILIIFSFIFANLPWYTSNFLIFFPKKNKTLPLMLLEVLILYLIWSIFLISVEKQVVGNVHSQDWEFYTITFFLFIVFSFPGFVYKVIWK
ncbi:MAG: DUF2818 family protein [Methylophilaceae bacterium]|nr:DUF2818 family protein [Methylophilaceae bacterium]MBL6726767.1 DUF2818 family protein [Methylophilaceae bacterium]MBL6728239.1 DUF2818 family protein [Methylophilaceae bacterium]MBL6791081.1 DUF2818 family protein [Methylophilaceae bacterium]